MELDKLSKLEQPPLPSAYIRSLVKQLTTSGTKVSVNPKDQNFVVNGGVSHGHNSKHGKVADACRATQSTQPQQHKKQVRRRLHTSRPYQERLLNMAEARREIVTALKFHRAAMKEASEQKQQQQKQTQEQQRRASVSLRPDQDVKFKSRRNQRIYPACTSNFSGYKDDLSYSCLSQPPPSVPKFYTWPSASPITPPHLMAENPNFILPNQTLGLNLNFQDFNNLDATFLLNNSSSSSNSSATSSSPPEELPSLGISQGEGFYSMGDTVESNAATQVTVGLHTAMDDEGMAEIRSLGEQYQMEWNDTMNLVKSACWFKFLKNMENRAPEAKNGDDAYHNFDQLLEFPAWLNESCLEQCSVDYFQDSSLPRMDIGDFDSMDDDWLA
ncbi:hypothetical protein PHAVU_009G084600 [Phaseolus vulgaris]|uniref:Uncharacterized protein n=1 Tax=Phaseolus vulgaris TaxID=3885 RepID=V7ATK6_PHAVU|nr:hypothetical protein PHAVU_009G084600g [Phaseolus vulgaris]ESW08909.1 hypothetical protein PHAVU_009G084600g [Phaseolus vulgaris]